MNAKIKAGIQIIKVAISGETPKISTIKSCKACHIEIKIVLKYHRQH